MTALGWDQGTALFLHRLQRIDVWFAIVEDSASVAKPRVAKPREKRRDHRFSLPSGDLLLLWATADEAVAR